MPHCALPSYLIAVFTLNSSFFACLSPHQGKLLGIARTKSIVWQRLGAQQIVAKWITMKLIYCGVLVHWGINLEWFYVSNNCYQLSSVEPSLFLLNSRLP